MSGNLRPAARDEVSPYPTNPVRYRQATPDDVEQRLYGLGQELDAAVDRIQAVESEYLLAKTDYEIAYARAYMNAEGSNMKTRDAHALLACAEERRRLVAVEAMVKAEKENARRIYAHVDLARSVSVIVRAGIGAA